MTARLHGLVGLETHLTTPLEPAAKLVVMIGTAINHCRMWIKETEVPSTTFVHLHKGFYMQDQCTG